MKAVIIIIAHLGEKRREWGKFRTTPCSLLPYNFLFLKLKKCSKIVKILKNISLVVFIQHLYIF